MNCSLCNAPLGMFSPKIGEHKVCKKCLEAFPSNLLSSAHKLTLNEIQTIIDYINNNKKKFQATSSYGNLHIDEIHGLFAIADKLQKGKVVKGDVYSIYELSEVYLSCKTPKVENGRVYVSVEFKCFLEHFQLGFDVIVKRKAYCETKRVDNSHVIWEEPKDLQMFRTLFNQMLKNEQAKLNQYLVGTTIYQFELEKARYLFMLPNEFTKEELEESLRNLLRVYNSMGDERPIQVINQAYSLLLAFLRKKESEEQNESN